MMDVKELETRYDKLREKQYFLGDIAFERELGNIEQYKDKEGNVWLMQSQYSMAKPQSVWMEQFDGVENQTVFLIYGLGLHKHIYDLSKKYPSNLILVYEPNDSAVIYGLSQEDWWLYEAKNVILVAGENKESSFSLALETLITYENFRKVYIAALPNYVKAFSEDYENFCENLFYREEVILMEKCTGISRGTEMAKNTLYNTKRLFRQAGFLELKKAIQQEDLSGRAAVLISAGPSLDKNIRVLKEHQDKVFIACVDVALKAALKQGITPDIVVAIDSHVGRVAGIEDKKDRAIPLLTDISCCKEYVENFQGRIFYTGYDSEYVDSILSDYGKKLTFLPTGGSVANTAFSMLKELGFKTIILIGQDLAYPNNKLHADNTIANEELIDASEDEKYYYVDAVDGGKVLTEKNMSIYRRWFEDYIRANRELRVIDATEGGALIKGTEIMTLGNALEQFDSATTKSFKERVNSAEYYLEDKDQLVALDRLNRDFNGIEAMEEKFHSARKLYQRLQDLNEKAAYQTREFQKCLNKIKKFNTFVENEEQMILYKTYIYKDIYEVKDAMNRDESTTYEEIKLVVDSGIKMIDAYLEAAELMKRDWIEVCQEEQMKGDCDEQGMAQ